MSIERNINKMKENIMNTLKMTLALALVILLTGCNEVSQTQPNANGKTYVLVHGAWGGGWAFREVDDMLTAQGHKVYRPTLTGQGERVHLATLDVGLDTHITDVVNTVLFEELDDIVLVGHSYGGMVVTGVADRIPNRISHLIYLDAMIPEDGESSITIGGMHEQGWLPPSAKDGFMIPAWVKADQAPPKDVPHPLKTFTDKISLKNPDRMKITTDYILTVDPGKEPKDDGFYDSYKRAKQYNWTTHILSSDHNPQWSKPNELYKLLNDIPAK
jgi:pimeloyl-ACP methyl ester carboxylesterase